MKTPIKNAYWGLVGSKLSQDNEGFEQSFFMGAAWMIGVLSISTKDGVLSKKIIAEATKEILTAIERNENEG